MAVHVLKPWGHRWGQDVDGATEYMGDIDELVEGNCNIT